MRMQRISANLNVQFKKLFREPGFLFMNFLVPLLIAGMLYLFAGKQSIPMSDKTIFETMIPGLFVLPALMNTIFVAVSFSQVRFEGILKRIYTTPTNSKEYLGSVIFSNSIIAIIQIALMSVFLILVGFRPDTNFLGMALASIIITIFYVGAISMGLLAAIIANKINNASGIANIYSVPQMNLMFFTFAEAEIIRRFIPVYYPMDAITRIFDGIVLTDFTIWFDFGINLIITTAIVVIAIALFKKYGKN